MHVYRIQKAKYTDEPILYTGRPTGSQKQYILP
jgi:hypothetical protein